MHENARELAFAKLTRSLRVLGRRSDGYHLIDAEMVALDFADELELVEQPERALELELVDAIAWTGSEDGAGPPGPVVPAGPENLVLRALALAGVGARVTLTKRIPPGAGLGGGSADAAAALRWAGVRDPLVAARLGADVPFCLLGGRARVRGVGELLEPLEPLEASYLLLTPAYGAATPAVYAAYDEVGPPPKGGANDLEAAALVVESRLARARDVLAEVSGVVPTLAGSGATWFVACPPGRGGSWAEELRLAVTAERARAVVTLARTVGVVAP